MLTLEHAARIVDVALSTARSRSFAPLTVAVLDAGGFLKALKREDGTSNLRPDMAIAKAWGGLALGWSSREIGVKSAERPLFFQQLNALAGGKILSVAGGVLIKDATGQVIGAVGITGDTSDNDELCAVEGIKAAGLTPVV